MQRTPLYSSRQIGIGALLGGPLAATFMLRGNFLGLQRAQEARRTVIIGILATILVLALAIFLPIPRFMNSVIPISYAVIAQTIAHHYGFSHQRILLSSDFVKQSHWKVLGVSAVFLALTFAISIPVLMALLLAFPKLIS